MEIEVFDYITNDVLRKNIVSDFEHVIYLQTISSTTDKNKKIRSHFYKDMVVHLGSIIEAILFFEVSKIESTISQTEEWKYKNEKELYKISDEQIIIGCEKFLKKTNFKLQKSTTFKALNDICKDNGVITQELYEKCEKIRDMRNKIHITGLDKVEKIFKLEDVEESSSVIFELIQHLNP
ncbi:hypothetical protein KC660_04120 [Candidatus Dojkabacteria bacterium]|uniref:Uncharacterized protein n=1 Tax=Candidatus Dojkabacteria bacterium TaxID=2099670 RepID=A0A955L476_9BACT|nr:hypothetical protein [Candidatus Dojkabacteria bacterium]